MIKDNIKALINWIIILCLVLAVCVTVDYATDDVTVCNNVSSKVNLTKTEKLSDGGVYVDLTNKSHTIVMKSSDKIHYKYPIVSMWARPSVRCNLPYKWYYRSFVDYCPHCKRYGVLYDAHKPQAKYEHEWTCKRCGADYDAVIGKEKYSWSHYYLRRA